MKYKKFKLGQLVKTDQDLIGIILKIEDLIIYCQDEEEIEFHNNKEYIDKYQYYIYLLGIKTPCIDPMPYHYLDLESL
jgi:hypothetical protein